MRRPATALILMCLLGIGPTSAVSEEASPGYGDPSRRVEVPDHGFAIRLPEAWAAEWVERADAAASGLVLTTAEPEQYCIALSGSLDGVSFEDMVSLIPAVNEAKEDTSLVDGPVSVELPSGRGVVFDVLQGPQPLSPAAQYLVEGDGRFLSIDCVGHERPLDDWRSVAEAFEWIPLRYRHPEASVAIMWPQGWNVSEYEDPAEWGGLIYGTIGDDTVCTLADEGLFRMGGQDGRSLDAVTAAWRRAQPFGEPVDVGGLHPSVRRAVRLDSADRSMYFLMAGETIISLSCQAMPPAPGPPEDRWLPIAETFEFPPVDG